MKKTAHALKTRQTYAKKSNTKNRLRALIKKYPKFAYDDKMLWVLYVKSHCHFYSEVFERVIMDDNTPTMSSLDRTRRKIIKEMIYAGEL